MTRRYHDRVFHDFLDESSKFSGFVPPDEKWVIRNVLLINAAPDIPILSDELEQVARISIGIKPNSPVDAIPIFSGQVRPGRTETPVILTTLYTGERLELFSLMLDTLLGGDPLSFATVNVVRYTDL